MFNISAYRLIVEEELEERKRPKIEITQDEKNLLNVEIAKYKEIDRNIIIQLLQDITFENARDEYPYSAEVLIDVFKHHNIDIDFVMENIKKYKYIFKPSRFYLCLVYIKTFLKLMNSSTKSAALSKAIRLCEANVRVEDENNLKGEDF